MTEEEFQDFIADASDQMKARVNRAREEFGIGEYERFELDLTTGRIWWSDGEIAKVEAKLIVVGSVSTVSNTWLWGWANPHLEGVEIEEIERVRAFGEEHSIEKLSERKWPADEIDGWEMTAVAARLLETEAAYRTPSRTGFLYLLLTDLRKVP